MSADEHARTVHLGVASQRLTLETTVRIGLAIRAARRAVGWSQRSIADRIGCSQTVISRIERGRIDAFDLEVVLALGHELGLRSTFTTDSPFPIAPRRARDPVHAACVAYAQRRVGRSGWLTGTEVEVGKPPWMGWIDLLAFHPATEALLIQEVKTEIHDAGDEQRRLGRYERDAVDAARVRGWRPRTVRSGILMLATDRNDERLSELGGWARTALPVRAATLTAWLANPATPLPGRTLAMIDPFSRRERWLRPTRLDGRRTPAPYRDYAEVAQLLRRRR
jgi:transcriptional regulator with XRE-family HTH domain